MSFETEIISFCKRLDRFVLDKMQSEGSYTVDKFTRMQRLIYECTAIMYPSYMQEPIRKSLRDLDIKVPKDEDFAGYLFKSFLAEVQYSTDVGRESSIIKCIDSSITELSNIEGYRVNAAAIIPYACSQIDNPLRAKIFSEVVTALYRNKDGVSLTALEQCYENFILYHERLETASQELDRRIDKVTEETSTNPILILRKDFGEAISKQRRTNLPDDSHDFYDIVQCGLATKGELTDRCKTFTQFIIQGTLLAQDVYAPFLRPLARPNVTLEQLIAQCVQITPSSIISPTCGTLDFLTDIFFNLIPGRKYTQYSIEGNCRIEVQFVHVKKRHELRETINEILEEHKQYTQESLKQNNSWALMSILMALTDIVHEIYGENTLANFVLPMFLAKLHNHVSVFELSPEFLTNFFWQFVPRNDVRCRDVVRLNAFQKSLEKCTGQIAKEEYDDDE